MDFRFRRLAWYVMPSVVALALAGCGGSDSKTTTAPDAKLPEVATPTEVTTAGSNQVVINYVDTSAVAGTSRTTPNAGKYAKYNLYTWNNETCDALADSSIQNNWDASTLVPTAADTYGPTWVLDVTKETGCVNFILRDGDNNKLIGSDMMVNFTDHPDRTVSVVAGKTTVYPDRASAFNAAFGVAQASAHLVDANTLLWEGGKGKAIVRLYYSTTGNIAPDSTGVFKDKYITLTPATLTDAQKATIATKFNHLKDYAAFTLPSGADLKGMLKGEVVALATNDKGILQAATLVQSPGALDALYADKAKEQQYGAIVGTDGVTFRLWAPTAQNVKLALYNADKTPASVEEMKLDTDTGAWSYAGSTDLKGKYYRYQITVYHPTTRKVESYEVTDPYSLSLSMNSEYSQVVDLNDADLKPTGWDDLKAPHSQATQQDVAKMVVHESHVRDLTAFDTGIPAAERGKFVGLADSNSLAVKHLQDLSKAGVTHLQLLPAFDIATVNEDPAKVANLDDPFSKLCDVNSNVKNSTQFNSHCSSSETIADVMASLDKDGEDRQALNRMVADTDSYNWGYDPYHYTVPEGSYATDADGTTRIKEFREMVMAIKQNIGMNVVMDVVYNHTNAAGLADKSVLDKVVPWYYQRLNETTGNVENSTCCSNTAPENAMFAKLMDDSLVTWARDYKIDAFRFDLMGHHPKAQMVEALAKVKAVDPEMYFYGEGWNFGEVQDGKRFVQATQANLAGTGIGTFSDRLRDAVRGGSPFDSGDGIRKTQGFGNGAYVLNNETDAVTEDSARHLADLTMLGMAGNLKDFVLTNKDGTPSKGSDIDYNGQQAGYAQDPIEIQNYVSKHDNQTIFDIIAYKADSSISADTRIRMQAVSLATVMLGQGTVFDQQGSELLRSKSFERDSYDSGDWYNKVDYTKAGNNFDVGLPRKDKDESNYDLIKQVKPSVVKPDTAAINEMESFYKELTALRASSPLFTLGSGSEVMKRVDFRNVGPDQKTGVIAMTIDDGTAVSDLDKKIDGAVVIINATPNSQTIGDFKDADGNALALSGYTLSSVQSDLGTASIGQGSTFDNGEFTVPAWSAAVFIKAQGDAQGTGLPVGKKQDMSTIAPFGDLDIYLPGALIGSWNFSDANKFAFTGADYSYALSTEVTSDIVGDGSKTVEIKVADDVWGDTSKGGKANYGACAAGAKLTAGTPLTLCSGDAAKGNIALDLAKVGTYHFTFKAMNKDNPVLTLAIEEPAAACELLPDSSEAATLGATKLAIRGEHSSWNWDASYQLTYKGNGIYEAKAAGSALNGKQFKLAADTSNWDPQFFATQGGTLVKSMTPETVYEAFGRFAEAGTDAGNNTITLDTTANYLFRLKLDTSAEMTGAGIKGTFDVCKLAS